MRIQLVEVTSHDSSWKGTWYRTGERHFVRQDPVIGLRPNPEKTARPTRRSITA